MDFEMISVSVIFYVFLLAVATVTAMVAERVFDWLEW